MSESVDDHNGGEQDELPTCQHTGCDYTAKYKHTHMQGEMEIARYWCGHHAGNRKWELEQIRD